MLFNTFDFAVFFPIVFFLYWFVTYRSLKIQNFLLVIASYVFYGWWDWKFLILIFLSTIVDFTIGIIIDKHTNQNNKKAFLWISILVNLGILGYFKYCNFFIENFIYAFTILGKEIQANTLDIIIPVGISFYTFQTMSYTIDIYRGKLKPTRNFLAFAAFISFFPQLVAGPIERATNLLPQFFIKRTFSYNKAVDGMRQILWGLFKKVVIADNCAIIANLIFNDYSTHSGSTLLLGALFFAFQIYGDFSGYSDIAIGVARLLGFELKQNFSFPYFSRDIAEFWRRWHISLSTWFRDYLYIPLGGSRVSTLAKIRNTFIIFIVSGFWHGANWTFIAWGTLNALGFLPLLILRQNRKNLGIVAENKLLPSLKELLSILSTFLFVVLGWIFFRSETITQAFDYILIIFSKSLFLLPKFSGIWQALLTITFIIFMLIIEWLGRKGLHALEFDYKIPRIVRWGFYYTLIFAIFRFGGTAQDFIYFQF